MAAQANLSRSLNGIYILSFVGVVVPLVSLAGAIWASFINEEDDSRASSHCKYILDTYWMSILINLGFILAVAIGHAALRQKMSLSVVCYAFIPAVLFYLYRTAMGYRRFQHGE